MIKLLCHNALDDAVFEQWAAQIRSGNACAFGVSPFSYAANLLGDATPVIWKKIFDNNQKLQGKEINGCGVCTPTALEAEKQKIIIMTSYGSIKRQLESYGLEENKDFINGMNFHLLYQYMRFKTINIPKLTVSVGSGCTLRCKECIHHVGQYSAHTMFSPGEFTGNVDEAMRFIDYAESFVITGGEPFLHKSLAQLIQYVFTNYTQKIGTMLVITNGTIIPGNNLLKTLAQYDVEVKISDYSPARIPTCIENQPKLLSLLSSHNIRHRLSTGGWGKMYTKGALEHLSPQELQQHYTRCANTECMGFVNGKFYTCLAAWAAEDCGVCACTPDDFLDMATLNKHIANDVLLFLNHYTGFNPKGYLELCKHCYGKDPDYFIPVPIAQQRE